MFIESARDQNIIRFMTVHGDQHTVHKVYDGGWDKGENTVFDSAPAPD